MTNLSLFNPKTGEVFNTPLIVPKKYKKFKEESWMMLFQNGFKKLAKNRSLSGSDLRILFFMIFLSDFENLVITSQQNIAKELDLTQPAVARSIKKLVDSRCLRRIEKNGKHFYGLNDGLVWKGKPENRELSRKGKK
jgi:biotin operon repressor